MTNAELIKALRNHRVCDEDKCSTCELMDAAADALEAADKRIAELSLDCELFQQKCMEMEAQMPKEGEWIPINWNEDALLFKCSVCGEVSCCDASFCNNCGAKMKGANDESD